MNLLMLTKFYPYGTDEAFIENEIMVLSEYFTKITIIACEVPEDEHRIRSIPENVTAYRVNAGNRIGDCIIGVLKRPLLRNEAFREELHKCKKIRKHIFLSYFEEKSQRVFKNILNQGILKEIIQEEYVLYSYWLFMTARVGILISELKKPAYMFARTHRYDLYEERNGLNYLPYRELFLDTYDNVFPCSDDGTKYLRYKYPEYATKIETAFLGTLDHGIRKKSTDGVFRIVSCSRIVPLKRVERIVEALALIDNDELKIKWTHIGGGSRIDNLKRLAHDKLKHVEFSFTGNVSNTEVLDIYSKFPIDLFLNVSSSEGLPVSIMEAISFGIPVIATDVGGTGEIVKTDYTGQLIPKDFSNDELAGHIRRFYLMHEKQEYEDYRANCRACWEEHFQAIPNYNKLCHEIQEHYMVKL